SIEFVPEAFSGLIDHDHVLPVRNGEACRAGEIEDWAVGFDNQLTVTPLAADVYRLGNRRAPLGCLQRGCPQRSADGHRLDLGVAALAGVRRARLLVFLGETRVERPPEVDVAAVPAGADEDALLRLHVDVLTVGPGGDSGHAPSQRALADD